MMFDLNNQLSDCPSISLSWSIDSIIVDFHRDDSLSLSFCSERNKRRIMRGKDKSGIASATRCLSFCWTNEMSNKWLLDLIKQMTTDFSQVRPRDVSILAAACFAYFLHFEALACEREKERTFASFHFCLSNYLRKSFKSSLIFSRHLN